MSFRFIDHLDKYPPAIARENITDHFPWLPSKTLSWLEERGEGPAGAFFVGKKKLYPTDELLSWLDSRAKQVVPKTNAVKVVAGDVNTKKRRRGRKTKAEEVRARRG